MRYSPDFLVRTEEAVYLVETKAQKDLIANNMRVTELLEHAKLTSDGQVDVEERLL